MPNEKIVEFLSVEPVAIEEVLARGMLICWLPYKKIVALRDESNDGSWFDSQIGYIDNWRTCDIFALEYVGKLENTVRIFLN